MMLSRNLLAIAALVLSARRVAAVRIVSKEELATKTSRQGDAIWLSVMGEVYDVSAGPQFYAYGNSYYVFSGKNADVPFITGNFNEKEAEKPVLDTLTDEQIYSLETWREFYEKEEKYPFVGVLEGEYFDSEGNPTEVTMKLREIIKVEKVNAEIREAERKAKIAARREKRRLEKKANESSGKDL